MHELYGWSSFPSRKNAGPICAPAGVMQYVQTDGRLMARCVCSWMRHKAENRSCMRHWHWKLAATRHCQTSCIQCRSRCTCWWPCSRSSMQRCAVSPPYSACHHHPCPLAWHATVLQVLAVHRSSLDARQIVIPSFLCWQVHPGLLASAVPYSSSCLNSALEPVTMLDDEGILPASITVPNYQPEPGWQSA